jgi:hypothetical protein
MAHPRVDPVLPLLLNLQNRVEVSVTTSFSEVKLWVRNAIFEVL